MNSFTGILFLGNLLLASLDTYIIYKCYEEVREIMNPPRKEQYTGNRSDASYIDDKPQLPLDQPPRSDFQWEDTDGGYGLWD